jgi:hypothetical protein
MKLVLLEALIVLIAMRAVLALMNHAPPWPNAAWEFFAGVAVVALATLAMQALLKRRPSQKPVAPPHIPLERIGPFRAEAMPVRFGARGDHDIHLN